MNAYRQFRIVYAVLALNFIIPAISYIAAPEMTEKTLDQVNRALGGGPYPFVESGQVWHMLAVGNVMTLGFMCTILFVDLRRFYPALPALVFLKAFSAVYSAVIGTRLASPAFHAIAVLDGTTTLAMIFFAVRAHNALAIEETLVAVERAGIVPKTPGPAQIQRGIRHMVRRLVFRPETVGTSKKNPVRANWRARLLAWRAIRIPFLIHEHAIAPLDLSGLASSPERIIRHLLGAHHDGVQFAYDLELLALHPGRLEELRDRARYIVENDTPRSRWLRDLTVFEGYHEALLAAVEKALRDEPLLSENETRDPDISLRAYLSLCAGGLTPDVSLRA
jgi:hypothetical protein